MILDLKYSQSRPHVNSNKLSRIYQAVTKPKEIKYKPIRKHYNFHLFG